MNVFVNVFVCTHLLAQRRTFFFYVCTFAGKIGFVPFVWVRVYVHAYVRKYLSMSVLTSVREREPVYVPD